MGISSFLTCLRVTVALTVVCICSSTFAAKQNSTLTLQDLEIKIGRSIDNNSDDSITLLARGFFHHKTIKDTNSETNPMAATVSLFYVVNNDTIIKVNSNLVQLAAFVTAAGNGYKSSPEYKKLFNETIKMVPDKDVFNGLLTFMQLYWIYSYQEMGWYEGYSSLPEFRILHNIRAKLGVSVDNTLCQTVVHVACS